MFASFAPSKESNMSLNSIKENTRPQIVQQTKNYIEGEFLLTLWSKPISAQKHLELFVLQEHSKLS